MTKTINENYFDKESKSMYYVLGAFYAGYRPNTAPKNGIIFQSKHRDLVQIVKDELGSEHEIITYSRDSEKRDRNSYFLNFGNHSLRTKLGELGLNKPKSKRTFPKNLDEKYASHFVRGFIEARARVSIKKNGSTNLRILFNKPFVRTLHNMLIQYADVKGVAYLADGVFSYNHQDSLKIHDFIYQDMAFIKKHNLFLPSQKNRFNFGYVPKAPKFTQRALAKVEKVKQLLRDGLRTSEVCKMVGYSFIPTLHLSFKKYTGQTVREWRRENDVETPRRHVMTAVNKLEKAKRLLLKGVRPIDASRLAGYAGCSSMYRYHKEHTGESLSDWIKENVRRK
jgi:AraC-like DNA-binding protein